MTPLNFVLLAFLALPILLPLLWVYSTQKEKAKEERERERKAQKMLEIRLNEMC